MSLFKHYMQLNELQVNGQNVDDNDDFNVGDEDEATPTNAEAQAETPSDQAQAAADTEAENQTADVADDNAGGDDDLESEDDFTLDDDIDTGDEDTSDDTTNTDEASEEDSGADDNTGDETADDGGDDDFTVDGGEDSGDSDGGEGEASGDDSGNNSSAPANNAPTDPTDSVSDDEDRAAEEAIYDSLTDDQKRIRVLQLKLDYKELYETFNTTLDGVNNIPKNADNLETIKRLTMLITKAKSILIDYIENNFDSNPYLENYTMYVKYMAVFRTAAKVIEEINVAKEH